MLCGYVHHFLIKPKNYVLNDGERTSQRAKDVAPKYAVKNSTPGFEEWRNVRKEKDDDADRKDVTRRSTTDVNQSAKKNERRFSSEERKNAKERSGAKEKKLQHK